MKDMDSTLAPERINYAELFVEIVRAKWKARRDKSEPFRNALSGLIPDEREKGLLSGQILSTLSSTKFVSLLTESEIGANKGFFSDASARLSFKFLPPIEEPDELRTHFDRLFSDKKDYQWVQAVPDEEWVAFLKHLFEETDPAIENYVKKEVLNSIMILAQRAATLGVDPEVVSKIPRVDDLDSPFLGLNREVMLFVEKTLNYGNYTFADQESDYKHILVMISQCKNQISYIYKHKDLFGISLQLTYLVRQIEQYLKRLAQLLESLQTSEK